MGMIPRSLGDNDTIDWLPVDVAAKSIVEIALSRVTLHAPSGDEREDAMGCFNLVNPHTTKWSEVVTAIQEYFSSKNGIQIKDVEFTKWLDQLMKVDIGQGESSAEEISRLYPALRLLDLFQGWKLKRGDKRCTVRLAIERAIVGSKTLAEARLVDADMMGRWLSGWDF